MRRLGKQSDLGSSLSSLVARLDRSNKGAYQQMIVRGAWESVAGDATKAHTTGAHIKDGELVVFVDSPLWATELSALSERYRVAINEEIGKNLVKTVRFIVSRKVETIRREQALESSVEEARLEDKVESIALSGDERRRVEDSVKAIEDLGLREAVLKATITDLEWKKGIAARKSREEPRGRS